MSCDKQVGPSGCWTMQWPSVVRFEVSLTSLHEKIANTDAARYVGVGCAFVIRAAADSWVAGCWRQTYGPGNEGDHYCASRSIQHYCGRQRQCRCRRYFCRRRHPKIWINRVILNSQSGRWLRLWRATTFSFVKRYERKHMHRIRSGDC